MTRTRAWVIAILATAGLLALVVGVGANTGQFGFRSSGPAVQAEAGVQEGGQTEGQLAVPGGDQYADDDEYEGHDERDDDDEYEHDDEYEGDDGRDDDDEYDDDD